MPYDDEHWMRLALDAAHDAAEILEVPVGAVIVRDDQLVCTSHNLRETTQDPLGHAETLAIRKAARILQSWRLEGCTLYCTVEPCLMCSGAILQSHLDRVVYGCPDPRFGAVETLYKVLEDERLNHHPEVLGGVLAEESAEVIHHFFTELRKRKKAAKDEARRLEEREPSSD